MLFGVSDDPRSRPLSSRPKLGIALGVLVALALIAATATVTYQQRSRRKATLSQLERLVKAVRSDFGEKRESDRVEFALFMKFVRARHLHGQIVIDGDEWRDGWGRPLRFEWRHVHDDKICHCFAVWSCGADGVDEHGEGDDIVVTEQQDRTIVFPDALLWEGDRGGDCEPR
jgi:hypothetical protein